MLVPNMIINDDSSYDCVSTTVIPSTTTPGDNVTNDTTTTMDGLLASAGKGDNGNIRIWDPKTSHELYHLVGHSYSSI